MNPSRIVITGLIASGKSTLAAILREEGFVVIDSDKVNKKLIEEGGTNYLAIKNEADFKEAFDGDRLDKNKLGQIIFSDPKKMEKLNSITHKNIIRKIEKEIESVDKKTVFIEIPLYFQMKEKFENDGVILVTCKKDVQIKRLMARDKINESFAKKKIESQDTLAYMVDNSDIIIDNSGDEEELRIKIKNMLDRGNY